MQGLDHFAFKGTLRCSVCAYQVLKSGVELEEAECLSTGKIENMSSSDRLPLKPTGDTLSQANGRQGLGASQAR